MLTELHPVILLDGAMGTMLQEEGLLTEQIPERINLEQPEAVIAIHQQYLRSGAQILYTNTFGVNRYKIQGSGYTVEELITAGIRNARTAIQRERCSAQVALCCGPIGKMLQPNGDLSFEEAYDMFRETICCGAKAGADRIVLETIGDLLEMKAALLAAREHTSLPVFCTMTFEENGRTFTGVPLSCAAVTMEALGASAIGINCSLGPNSILPLIREMGRYTSLPLLVKANAGLPDPATGQYDISPEEFARQMESCRQAGVSLIGGCCGTTPEYIAQIRQQLESLTAERTLPPPQTILCSGKEAVLLQNIHIVGERINPTGKKRLKEALRQHDMSYLLNQALEQTTAGAEILDVNVGLPEIDEAAMMRETVKALQAVTDAPLQIDSSDPAAIEAGLRVYNGKPLVNSVNGEAQVLHAILPLVKKYGAAVVGLTMDETGIPNTAEGRLAIARRIVETACQYGIAKQDILIDCLTLTVSAQQEQAAETLRAVRLVKKQLGVKTTLGVSNISFGLPQREQISSVFLTAALEQGLDLPIMNPNSSVMRGTVDAFRVLHGYDLHAKQYVARYTPSEPATFPVPAAEEPSLSYAVEHGLQQQAAQVTAQLLSVREPSEIIDTILIPALDKVGTGFETGKLFLPQLIQSAAAAQASFEVIRRTMTASQQITESKGKIVVATVKGDVHDIGKNIVKVVLENYGYEVIDLGKDVPPQVVVETVLRERARLVGLSALMTTTVRSMEETIRNLREKTDCAIMVGGAVLTEEYAKAIGADYYAKDAKASADIAKKVLG